MLISEKSVPVNQYHRDFLNWSEFRSVDRENAIRCPVPKGVREGTKEETQMAGSLGGLGTTYACRGLRWSNKHKGGAIDQRADPIAIGGRKPRLSVSVSGPGPGVYAGAHPSVGNRLVQDIGRSAVEKLNGRPIASDWIGSPHDIPPVRQGNRERVRGVGRSGDLIIDGSGHIKPETGANVEDGI